MEIIVKTLYITELLGKNSKRLRRFLYFLKVNSDPYGPELRIRFES